MDPDCQANEGVHSHNQDTKHELKVGNKKPIIWWVIVGLLVIVLLAVTAVLIAVALRKSDSSEQAEKHDKDVKRGKQVCITKECIREANNLLTSIDDTKDPCEDFHKFACGKYVYHNQIGINSKSHNLFGYARNKLKHELKEILDKPIKDDDFQGISMARTFYKSCLSKDKPTDIQKFKYQQIQSILGDWPANVSQWIPPSTYSWEEKVVNLLKLNIYSVLTMLVGPDKLNNSRNIIWILAPLRDSLILTSYYHIQKPKPSSNNRTVDQRNLDLLNQKMAEVPFNQLEEQRMTIAEMKSQFKQVNWDILLSIFPEKVHLTEEDIVGILSPKQFEHIVNTISSTNFRDVQNFLYESAMLQIPKINSFSWDFCVHNTENLFRSIVSHEYMKKHLNEEAMTEVKDMAKKIKDVLIEKLMEADGLDDKTRQRAINKVKKMLLVVGPTDEYYNEDALMEDYKEINIRANDYFNNAQKVEAMLVMKNFTKLREPLQRDDWFASPLIVNAFNTVTRNIFVFPAAFLVFPFVSSKIPAYFSFGRLGFIVGHEISHGFDSFGITRNEFGLEEMWWTSFSIEKYAEKIVCFEAQYNATKDIVTGFPLNGRMTLGENMADTGGLKLSYTAFKKWLTKHPSVPALPHFHNYTPEQMFFITFANTWCELYTEEARLNLLETEGHSLGRYRINIPLKNLREFGDVFNCSKTAKMRLEKRCELF